MPSKSPAQASLMAAVAHNPGFAKKAGVPQSVGKEFNQADRQRAQAAALLKRKKAAPAPAPAIGSEGGEY